MSLVHGASAALGRCLGYMFFNRATLAVYDDVEGLTSDSCIFPPRMQVFCSEFFAELNSRSQPCRTLCRTALALPAIFAQSAATTATTAAFDKGAPRRCHWIMGCRLVRSPLGCGYEKRDKTRPVPATCDQSPQKRSPDEGDLRTNPVL